MKQCAEAAPAQCAPLSDSLWQLVSFLLRFVVQHEYRSSRVLWCAVMHSALCSIWCAVMHSELCSIWCAVMQSALCSIWCAVTGSIPRSYILLLYADKQRTGMMFFLVKTNIIFRCTIRTLANSNILLFKEFGIFGEASQILFLDVDWPYA